MPDYVYFDTSAILRWAFFKAGSPVPRDKAGHDEVEVLLQSDAELAVSPVTLLEVLANFNQKTRDTNGWYAKLDAKQAGAVVDELMTKLSSSGRIVIRTLGNRAFEVALMWVNESIRNPQARILGKWDGIHLYEAVRWSRELGSGTTVRLATADTDFAAFLLVLPEIETQITVFDVCS